MIQSDDASFAPQAGLLACSRSSGLAPGSPCFRGPLLGSWASRAMPGVGTVSATALGASWRGRRHEFCPGHEGPRTPRACVPTGCYLAAFGPLLHVRRFWRGGCPLDVRRCSSHRRWGALEYGLASGRLAARRWLLTGVVPVSASRFRSPTHLRDVLTARATRGLAERRGGLTRPRPRQDMVRAAA